MDLASLCTLSGFIMVTVIFTQCIIWLWYVTNSYKKSNFTMYSLFKFILYSIGCRSIQSSFRSWFKTRRSYNAYKWRASPGFISYTSSSIDVEWWRSRNIA